MSQKVVIKGNFQVNTLERTHSLSSFAAFSRKGLSVSCTGGTLLLWVTPANSLRVLGSSVPELVSEELGLVIVVGKEPSEFTSCAWPTVATAVASNNKTITVTEKRSILYVSKLFDRKDYNFRTLEFIFDG